VLEQRACASAEETESWRLRAESWSNTIPAGFRLRADERGMKEKE
jgi:hypothetical protein